MNTNLPLVSIVTVTYNAASILEETILSVINQTYSNIEYIIIDGGSTDGTVDIIKKYETNLAYWISEPDKGIYDAMNKGIDKATGEWTNFMNAGDTFYSNEVLYEIFVGKYMEIISSAAFYGNTVYEFDTYSFLELGPSVHTLEYDKYFSHQSAFAKTELMKKYRFNIEMKICSDYLFFYQLYKDQYKIDYIPITISSFKGENGTSDQYRMMAYKECSIINKQYNAKDWLIKYFFFCVRIKIGIISRKLYSMEKLLKIRKRRIFDNDRVKWIKLK